MQATITKNCTGCAACRFLCPQECISIGSDEEGFYAPYIDKARCNNCGVCTTSCPQNSRPSFASNNRVISVLGARYKKDDVLLSKSASGGAFAGIASKILETPGNAAFGCAFDENIVARHISVTEIENIQPLQSSKYVQSDVGETYLLVKDLLDNGRTVFYTGCPCQIAGLYAFLNADYDNLLTADLVCHGVPSPLLFKRYIDKLEKRLGGKIVDYNFRSKKKEGWGLTGDTTISKFKSSQVKSSQLYQL